MSSATDKLSEVARQILSLSPDTAYQRLVVTGDGNAEAKRLLQPLSAADLLAEPVRGRESAEALLAGLWLWHDWLDESHRISQGIASATGSYWHAIMHRREGDFSNSKYWYARCRQHPALPELETAAMRAGLDPRAQANRLVDLVESASRNAQNLPDSALVRLQKLEWQTLFDWCIVAATRP